MSAGWWSQPFAPEGSAAAEGIAKQLGRPSLDPLTVLVREAAQNSWDARLPGHVVDFSVDIRVLGGQAESWGTVFGAGPDPASEVPLEKALGETSLAVVVSDRGTRGLGGPLRAGTKARDDERADFVQFLRNVGEPSDNEFGGGTYGFGKGIFYRLSDPGVILVDTQTTTAQDDSRRMMGAGLGMSWSLGNQLYTGRHWWGDVADDDVPDPLLGAEAAAVAATLGLPGFADGRTGTDVVILGADLGVAGVDQDSESRTPHEAATFIASSILWNLWPKMVPDSDGVHMRFRVGVDGALNELPPPETFDDLAPYVEALREVRAGAGSPFVRTVVPKEAGVVAMSLGAADSKRTRLIMTAARPYEGPSHHVARMRVAELVVDYLAGPVHPDTRLAYGGVFKASPLADELFASSEPPTHDDWVIKGLTGTARGVVMGAKNFVLKYLDERLGIGTQAGGGGGQGLGQLAAMLAAVVPARTSGAIDADSSAHGQTAPGRSEGGAGSATGAGSASSGGTVRRGSAPRIVGTPVLQVHEGQPFLVATVLVPGSDTQRTVTAGVEVVVEGGGRESEAPLGALAPEIMQWRSIADGSVIHGHSLRLTGGADSQWYVYATHVPDAVVRFKISQEVGVGR